MFNILCSIVAIELFDVLNVVIFDLVAATMKCAKSGMCLLMMMCTGSFIVFPCALSAVSAIPDLICGMCPFL